MYEFMVHCRRAFVVLLNGMKGESLDGLALQKKRPLIDGLNLRYLPHLVRNCTFQ